MVSTAKVQTSWVASDPMLKVVAVALALVTSVASSVFADQYPSRPIRLIVPFPAGGSNDVVGRIIANQLSARLGQQVFVDNRGTAGGIVGTEYASTSEPDGYTLLIVSVPHVVNPSLQKLRYDPIKSFTPIAFLGSGPNVLVVHPDLPVKSVEDLIKLAKQRPGELNYASAGISTFTHLTGELFKQMAGVDIVHVPYRGGGPAIQDVIAGHVKIMFSTLLQTAPLVKSGQLRAIATSGIERSPILPDIPTIAESGLPGYAANNWWGLVGPSGMPPAVVEKLYRATQDALNSEEMRSEFAREGASLTAMTSDGFRQYMQEELDKWARVVKDGHIQAQ